MIVSTCNRVEVYAVSENADGCFESVKEFLSEFHSIAEDSFTPYLYVSIGHMAVRHFYKVASGIDSMVVGEPQILGQIKQAYKTAVVKGTAGLILNRLSHSAFFVAKRVRTETGIGSRAVSVSSRRGYSTSLRGERYCSWARAKWRSSPRETLSGRVLGSL